MPEYWEVETPRIVEEGRRRYKYYKQSGVFEICCVDKEGTEHKEFRHQILSKHKIHRSPALGDLLIDFMEDAGLIERVKEAETEGEPDK